MTAQTQALQLLAASDASVLVTFNGGDDDAALAAVHGLTHALQQRPPPWLLDLHPAYRSLLVDFDAVAVDHDAVERVLRAVAAHATPAPAGRHHVVPVRYGGAFGPDLAPVSALLSMSEAEVIRRHSAARYGVAFLGFLPGFAYLTGLDRALRVPRLPAPRPRVEAGSVAIAAGQAAIYPSSGPGGWRVIGRTDLDVLARAMAPADTLSFEVMP